MQRLQGFLASVLKVKVDACSRVISTAIIEQTMACIMRQGSFIYSEQGHTVQQQHESGLLKFIKIFIILSSRNVDKLKFRTKMST